MKASASQPSKLMLEWLSNTREVHSWDVMLTDLFGGTHVNNPYHNHKHMLMVAWYAMHAWNEEIGAGEATNVALAELVYSACVHDHSHSGGFYKDDQFNIDEVRSYLLKPGTLVTLRMLGLNTQSALRVESNVMCTRFDAQTKTFPVEPDGPAQRALRDADLMSIYSDEGRWLICDLYEEMYGEALDEDATNEQKCAYLVGNVDFLAGAKMYTSYGKRMKKHHLRRSLMALTNIVVNGKERKLVWDHIKTVMDNVDQVNNTVNTTNG